MSNRTEWFLGYSQGIQYGDVYDPDVQKRFVSGENCILEDEVLAKFWVYGCHLMKIIQHIYKEKRLSAKKQRKRKRKEKKRKKKKEKRREKGYLCVELHLGRRGACEILGAWI
jgi:hypothetical protein